MSRKNSNPKFCFLVTFYCFIYLFIHVKSIDFLLPFVIVERKTIWRLQNEGIREKQFLHWAANEDRCCRFALFRFVHRRHSFFLERNRAILRFFKILGGSSHLLTPSGTSLWKLSRQMQTRQMQICIVVNAKSQIIFELISIFIRKGL